MNVWMIESLGWTLLHSLWQIGFVALILFSALRVLRDFSANLRYTISVAAICLAFILPTATFFYLSAAPKSSVAVMKTLPGSPQIAPPGEFSLPDKVQQTGQSGSDVPPDAMPASSSLNIPYLKILVGLWLLGVALFSIRLVGGVWTIHLYKTRQVSAVETLWQEKFDELCERLQIKQKIRFLQSKKVEMPVVIGWLKPVVLVPASAFLQISPKELETILLHELTHIKRHDYLVNFLQSLVEILFFYHPCVWWISAQIRAEREFAVDEFVAQNFENEKFIYAKALANLEEIRAVPTTKLAMAGTGGNLMKRIENILQGNKKINSKNVSIWSAIFAVTFILGITAGIYWLKSGEPKSAETAKSGRKIALVYGGFPTGRDGEFNQKFFNVLEKHRIPAVWIPSQTQLFQIANDEAAKSIIRNRYNQNIKIAVDANDSTRYQVVAESSFEQMVEKNLNLLNEILIPSGGKVDYFFFIDGVSYRSAIGQKVEKDLLEKGMKSIPASAPYYDSLFGMVYENNCVNETNKIPCESDSESRQAIREKYLQFMSDQFESMEKYSQEVLGREIPQVLYLSSSRINDETADQIFQMLKDRGYEFVPLDEVLSDEAYAWQEKVRKVMRFDRNRWDKTADYLKEELKITENRLEVGKPSPPKVLYKYKTKEK